VRRGRGWPPPSPRPGHRRATREKDGSTCSWGSSSPSRGAPPPPGSTLKYYTLSLNGGAFFGCLICVVHCFAE
jgi:hypothetical protein